ncbi:nucleotidyltransferase domain-containing protein [Candidatus Bathyarchaeota archaeon]|nr:nucleotidyltransferase domain-containing protein [Candidatus Bathyarchaeota archaeon]
MPKERLRREAYEKLESFLDRVKPLKPRALILFGSYARGDFTEESDIDVILIAENLPKKLIERRSLSSLYHLKKLMAIGYYPEEFMEELRRGNPFIHEALKEGVIIYSDGFAESAKNLLNEVSSRPTLRR